MSSEATSRADALVARWLLALYRRETKSGVVDLPWPDVMTFSLEQDDVHLHECAEAAVSDVDAERRAFWDTGVTGMEFSFRVACPHEAAASCEVQELGDLGMIIDDLIEVETREERAFEQAALREAQLARAGHHLYRHEDDVTGLFAQDWDSDRGQWRYALPVDAREAVAVTEMSEDGVWAHRDGGPLWVHPGQTVWFDTISRD